MATIKKYYDDIRRIANHAGDVKDDDRLQRRQIQFWMDQYRETLIIEKAYQINPLNPVIDSSWFQDFGCVPLCDVDLSECPELPYGCMVKKTKDPIPKFISLIDSYGNNRAIDFVGIINKRNRFYQTTASDVRSKLEMKYGGAQTFFYPLENYFYVATRNPDHEDLNWMNMRGALASPAEIIKCNSNLEGCAFNWETDDYPISGELANKMKMLILTRELNISMQFVKDNTNNSADDQ